MVSLCSVFFYKIDRIPSFDIRNSTFDIRYSVATERILLTVLINFGNI